MAKRFQSFVVEEITPTGRMKIRDPLTDSTREAFLVVNRDIVTNILRLDVAMHYTDPESQPWFEDSKPWAHEEVRA